LKTFVTQISSLLLQQFIYRRSKPISKFQILCFFRRANHLLLQCLQVETVGIYEKIIDDCMEVLVAPHLVTSNKLNQQ
jgi:hypothetical protein